MTNTQATQKLTGQEAIAYASNYEIRVTNVPEGAYTEDYLGTDRNQRTLAAAKKVVAQFNKAKKANPANFEPGMVATIERS